MKSDDPLVIFIACALVLGFAYLITPVSTYDTGHCIQRRWLDTTGGC
jgi:hypothetical protein